MNWKPKNYPRPSSQRELIKQTLQAHPHLVHPESLYLQLRKPQNRIGLGTIYSLLNQLAKEGYLLKCKAEDRRFQYRIKSDN